MVGANLDGVLIAKEERLDLVVFATKFGEFFGDEISVIEAASADVFINSGEGNDKRLMFGRRNDSVKNFDERMSESPNRIVFKIVNEGTN